MQGWGLLPYPLTFEGGAYDLHLKKRGVVSGGLLSGGGGWGAFFPL